MPYLARPAVAAAAQYLEPLLPIVGDEFATIRQRHEVIGAKWIAF